MQSFHILCSLIIYANKIFTLNPNNFMQRIPEKEIGQLFENGHFKNVQNEKVRNKFSGKTKKIRMRPSW